MRSDGEVEHAGSAEQSVGTRAPGGADAVFRRAGMARPSILSLRGRG